MKPYVINKNSWHFKFMSWMESSHTIMISCDDICSYRAKFIKLAALVLVLGVILLLSAGVAFFLGGHMLAGVLSWAVTGVFNEGALTASVAAAVTTVVLGTKYYPDLRDLLANVRTEKPDTFITVAYRSWREKHCTPITFE